MRLIGGDFFIAARAALPGSHALPDVSADITPFPANGPPLLPSITTDGAPFDAADAPILPTNCPTHTPLHTPFGAFRRRGRDGLRQNGCRERRRPGQGQRNQAESPDDVST